MSYDSGFVSFCFWDVVRLKTSGVRSWDFFFFAGFGQRFRSLGKANRALVYRFGLESSSCPNRSKPQPSLSRVKDLGFWSSVFQV